MIQHVNDEFTINWAALWFYYFCLINRGSTM